MVKARKAVEKHIKNTYLKNVHEPVGAKPELINGTALKLSEKSRIMEKAFRADTGRRLRGERI